MTDRERPYKEKKQVYVLIIVMIIMVAALLYLRFILGGDEDTWICKDSTWIEHGNPSSPMPTTPCK